jgi:hypothetical protein
MLRDLSPTKPERPFEIEAAVDRPARPIDANRLPVFGSIKFITRPPMIHAAEARRSMAAPRHDEFKIAKSPSKLEPAEDQQPVVSPHDTEIRIRMTVHPSSELIGCASEAESLGTWWRHECRLQNDLFI